MSVKKIKILKIKELGRLFYAIIVKEVRVIKWQGEKERKRCYLFIEDN